MTDPTKALREARAALDAVIPESQQVPRFRNFLAAPVFDDSPRLRDNSRSPIWRRPSEGGVALVVRGRRRSCPARADHARHGR